MPNYDVHIYAVVRMKVPGVEADNQIEACKKAEDMVAKSGDFHSLFDTQVYHKSPVEYTEYVDEIVNFLVDESGDPEFEKSTSYTYKDVYPDTEEPSGETDPD